MCNKLLLTVLLCGLTVATIGVDLDTILEQHKQSLTNLWHMRNKRSVNSRSTDDDCFNWYGDASDDCFQSYRVSSAECTNTAEEAKKSLSAQGADTRNNLVERGNGGCAELQQCEDLTDLLSFYYCYKLASGNGTSVLYKVSGDSNAEYNSLSVQYDNINADKNVCDTNVQGKYVQDLADTNKKFNECRNGGGVPAKPTTTISTTDSTTTDSTTTDSTTTESTTTESTTTESTTTESTTIDSTTADSTTVDSTTVESTTTDAESTELPSDPEIPNREEDFNSLSHSSEEDIGKLAALARKNIWDIIKRAVY